MWQRAIQSTQRALHPRTFLNPASPPLSLSVCCFAIFACHGCCSCCCPSSARLPFSLSVDMPAATPHHPHCCPFHPCSFHSLTDLLKQLLLSCLCLLVSKGILLPPPPLLLFFFSSCSVSPALVVSHCAVFCSFLWF